MKNVFAVTSVCLILAACAFGQANYGSFKDTGAGLVTNQPWCNEGTQGNGQDACIKRDAARHYQVTDGANATVGSLVIGLGSYQGTTAVPITDTNFHALIAAASDIKITAGQANVAGRQFRIRGDGVYTTGAASLLNAEAVLCTISGCASGTVLAPAGCTIVTTNQANNLTNGQFTFECTLTTATIGATGTLMAKGVFAASLGAATTAALSSFADTATAVSAAVDLTVNEFVNVEFKFSSSNAADTVTLQDLVVTETN